MSDVLSDAEITALVNAAAQPQPREQPSGGSRRLHRVRTVDFSRPTKFGSEHQRRIARSLETFCQTAASRLAAELRVPVELEVINTNQLTWSSAQSEFPAKSLAATIETSPAATRMLLIAELSFVLAGLECLLGGSPERVPRDRRLSEIDLSLARRIIDSIVHQLSLVWVDLAGLELSTVGLDLHSDAIQIASVSEPTFIVLIEGRLAGHSAMLGLLVPWLAIESVSERVAGHDAHNGANDAAAARAVHGALSEVPVTLRAEIGSIELGVEEVLGLQAGSIIRLGSQADAGVSLFVENVQLARAQPGRSGARRAVQIQNGGRS